MEQESTSSYKQIAKSTGIFGGSQVLTILSGLIRTKVLALLLGAAGVGLAGMFQSIIDLIRSVTSLGLSFSSVREIAEAHQTEDPKRIGHTVTMLKRWLWWTGIAGMILTIIFSPLISTFTFGDKKQTFSICLLAFCVLTGTLSSGQLALLQGLRKIGHMAKASAIGAVSGLIIALALYAWLGIKGIIPSLVAVSVTGLFTTWWFSRKIPVEKVVQSYQETLRKGGDMVKLGLFTVGSGLISTLTLFLVRSFILRNSDVASVGLFQAAWSICNLYLGAVLTAMGADYFPRLCGLKDNDTQIVRFVNQQTRFVLVVSTPIIVGMMLITTPVINLLFSSAFNSAVDLMRWQIVGTFLKVLVWPTGFVLLSKGKGFQFLLVESTWFIVYYLVTRLLWPMIGLEAAGVGYVVSYLIYLPFVLVLVKPLCSLKFEAKNIFLMVQYFLFVVIAYCMVFFLTGWILLIGGSVLLLSCVILSAIEFNRFLPTKDWIPKLKKLLRG